MTLPSTTTDTPAGTAHWISRHGVTPGRDHLRRGIPCQDAALTLTDPRPALILCDGRGSAPHAEQGSTAALRCFRDWLDMAEPFLQATLDAPGEPAPENFPEAWNRLSLSLYRALARVQQRLAAQRGGLPRDYEFTAVAFIGGRIRGGWFSVGDSVLTAEQNGRLYRLGRSDCGEHANETRFVRPIQDGAPAFYAGLLAMPGLTAVAGYSDGTAARFHDLRNDTPARAVSQLAALLRQGELSEPDLHELLCDRDWDAATGDDRSLALLVQTEQSVQSRAETEPTRIVCPPLAHASEAAEGTAAVGGILAPVDGSPVSRVQMVLRVWIIFGLGLNLGLLIGVVALRLIHHFS